MSDMPKKQLDHIISVRFTSDQAKSIWQAAGETGELPTSMIRRLVLLSIRKRLHAPTDGTSGGPTINLTSP